MAARSSNAVLRAATILDFIAEHPNQSFTMAELVRALKLSQSTCHSILSALVESGYLYRTTEKTYALGARILNLAQVAGDRSSLLQIAKSEMRYLSNKLDLVCSAMSLEDGEIVIRERSASARHVGTYARLGQKIPFRAPIAVAFFASSPNKAEEWLSHLPPGKAAHERQEMKKGLAFLRDHGFLAILTEEYDPTIFWSNTRKTNDFDKMKSSVILDIDDDEFIDVTGLLVPVYNAHGNVEFVFTLAGYDAPVLGCDIYAAAADLKAASSRVSAFVLDPAPSKNHSGTRETRT